MALSGDFAFNALYFMPRADDLKLLGAIRCLAESSDSHTHPGRWDQQLELEMGSWRGSAALGGVS